MAWNGTIVNSEILAVHAALVPSGDEGEVLLFGGDEHWKDQQECESDHGWKKTRVYDIKTHSLITDPIPSPNSDVFCAGHAFAADGRLLIVGGTAKWPEGDDWHTHPLDFLGHPKCWMYNPQGRTWVPAQRLNPNPSQPDDYSSGGRWYPAATPLDNGDVLALFGHPNQGDTRHRNTTPERFLQSANGWLDLPKQMAFPIEPGGSVRYLFFPRSFILPDGSLFIATPMPVDFEAAASGDGTYFSSRYNFNTGDYEGEKITEPAIAASADNWGYTGWDRPAVLLPLLVGENYRPRAIFCGDTNPVKIDLDPAITSPAWENTVARDDSVKDKTRRFSNAVLLPTGDVCLVGGVHVTEPEEPVNEIEIYNPGLNWELGDYSGTESWSVHAAGTHTRNYHSTALLLPNGKVWVAGGNTNADSGDPDRNVTVGGETKKGGIKQIELFEPDYIGVPDRIELTSAPKMIQYDEEMDIVIDRPASNVRRVALIRNGSVTHSTNLDQRYVELEIESTDGNTLKLKTPPNGRVAPPGYYMLWLLDNSNNPCKKAKFIRLAPTSCKLSTDHDTFGFEEVNSLGGGGQATFTHTFYLYLDGFIDTELTGDPTFEILWADDLQPVDDVTLVPQSRLLEVDPGDPDIPQRITYPFHFRFNNDNPFSTFTDTRHIRVKFTHAGHTCIETLTLTHSPNPYMNDIDPDLNNKHWLSTDLRVFKLETGDTKFGKTLGSSATDYIQEILEEFNSNSDSEHPFDTIPQIQADSPVDLATGPVRNFAIAKVRYRATTTTAMAVKVFFRSFNTVGAALAYDTSDVYKNSGPGTDTVPLLGIVDDEIISIPFFASPRVESRDEQPGSTMMSNQVLDEDYEIRNIAPGVSEVTAYFGCWLDINDETERFPLHPPNLEGPWAEDTCLTIQELMRERHQCLIAEVYFEEDPTGNNKTPGNSDNLSQRNLAILHSDNPGGPNSHLVMNTFHIKPSLGPDAKQVVETNLLSKYSTVKDQHWPDELFIRWHNLPKDSEVTVEFSDIDTADIMLLSSMRKSPVAFEVVNQHTLRFRVAGATWFHIPGGRKLRIPALLSVRLPDTVVDGQEFRISVHQIDGFSRRVMGGFEVSIPVSKAELILEEEAKTLSVFKHILTKIPTYDHWYPLIKLYVHRLGLKVDDLGGNSSEIHPNPDGSGDVYIPKKPGPEKGKPCYTGWIFSLILAVTLLSAGILSSMTHVGIVLTIGFVLMAALLTKWKYNCCNFICSVLDYLTLGSGMAMTGLAIIWISGSGGPYIGNSALIAGILTAFCLIISFALGCRGKCCDDPHHDCVDEDYKPKNFPKLSHTDNRLHR